MKPDDIEARKAANVLIEYCNKKQEVLDNACSKCKIISLCGDLHCSDYFYMFKKYRIPKEKK